MAGQGRNQILEGLAPVGDDQDGVECRQCLAQAGHHPQVVAHAGLTAVGDAE